MLVCVSLLTLTAWAEGYSTLVCLSVCVCVCVCVCYHKIDV